MDWTTAIDAWSHHLTGALHRSPDTVRTRTSWLRLYAVQHPIDATRSDIEHWYSQNPHWKPATHKSAQQSLRAFYTHAVARGWVSTDPTVDLPAVHVPKSAPRPCPELVYRRALAQVDNPRDRLALLLAGAGGLRRNEIAALRRADLDANGTLWVTGKGGVTRDIPLCGELLDLIRAAPVGWLFPGRFAGHIHPDALSKIMRRALHGESSAHRLRARFATVAYSADHDIRAVQDLLGHSSMDTTQRYVAVSSEAKRCAVQAAA